jgi:hypothetical protein
MARPSRHQSCPCRSTSNCMRERAKRTVRIVPEKPRPLLRPNTGPPDVAAGRATKACSSRTGKSWYCPLSEASRGFEHERISAKWPRAPILPVHQTPYFGGCWTTGRSATCVCGLGVRSLPRRRFKKASEPWSRHRDRTISRPVSCANPRATAPEWLICTVSFRWSGVSKKALRG